MAAQLTVPGKGGSKKTWLSMVKGCRCLFQLVAQSSISTAQETVPLTILHAEGTFLSPEM